MPRMLDVSDDVRAEIGDEEADRLLAGVNAPGHYDCTSCRTPGDTQQERTSTVLFVGDETAVLAFAHATCIPSQVVPVSEEQLQGAVRSITGDEGPLAGPPAPAAAEPAPSVPATPPAGPAPALAGEPASVPQQARHTSHADSTESPRQAVIGVTSGLVLIDGVLHAAIVAEPTGPVARAGTDGPGDDFLPLLLEHGFAPVTDVERPPAPLGGWSVLLVNGELHAVLQPGPAGPVAWWQAHRPLAVTEAWRATVNRTHTVLMFAGPAGSIGQQAREDLLRDALDKAATDGLLVGAMMPLTGA
ncbi:hypothetical protein [Streptomyces meridianus]|uniref:Uncharacterized protein n=1 Tax=Streptomyces meridianus TaxID=2938945 RepID=A0ABT0X276_9ACTN|nr:hypothetical protein [Streptomyces meridianus]MCM2576569.1 hypothetical protein [Streptomyces meridianus]